VQHREAVGEVLARWQPRRVEPTVGDVFAIAVEESHATSVPPLRTLRHTLRPLFAD
jgi:hypothetical protein